MKKALLVWGGWSGHEPQQTSGIAADLLREAGFETVVRDSLDALTDAPLMESLNLVVPCWTMGQIAREQEKGLLAAVASGVGLAGWHGGMCDAFRNNTQYQWMTGGQWVAHPGGCIPKYEVKIVDRTHEITRGLGDFTMTDTEQYYMHVDPSNRVLGTTTFESGCVMPVVWTRTWGKGRVFYSSLGHTHKDFAIPEVLEIITRGMLWAAR